MTKEEQRIAIAEACGFAVVDQTVRLNPEPWPDATVGEPPTLDRSSNRFRLICIDKLVLSFMWSNFGKAEMLRPTLKDVAQSLPDFLNDLNAMREAEESCITTEARQKEYWVQLLKAIDPEDESEKESRWLCAHATAAQRTEAFLRTIGKWKD